MYCLCSYYFLRYAFNLSKCIGVSLFMIISPFHLLEEFWVTFGCKFLIYWGQISSLNIFSKLQAFGYFHSQLLLKIGTGRGFSRWLMIFPPYSKSCQELLRMQKSRLPLKITVARTSLVWKWLVLIASLFMLFYYRRFTISKSMWNTQKDILVILYK